MKIMLYLTLCSCSYLAQATEYHPIEGDFGPFVHHELFEEFTAARSASSLQEAVRNWEALVDSLNVDDVEDMTHYQLVRGSLSELMRVYYLMGDTKEGDRLLRQIEDFQPTDKGIERKWKYLCGGNVELIPGEKI